MNKTKYSVGTIEDVYEDILASRFGICDLLFRGTRCTIAEMSPRYRSLSARLELFEFQLIARWAKDPVINIIAQEFRRRHFSPTFLLNVPSRLTISLSLYSFIDLVGCLFIFFFFFNIGPELLIWALPIHSC